VAEGLISKGSGQVRELSHKHQPHISIPSAHVKPKPSDQTLSPKGNLFFSTHSTVHNAVIKTQKSVNIALSKLISK
jgi:hypothetical protein